ncbi:MAG TPA: efflux RND transporter periplasmic adaptor subunit [Caulobacteraceae bacterium]|nr:efflux RND transporter periplasmic adaptor subunit [Caulobacteraceae bacterium]
MQARPVTAAALAIIAMAALQACAPKSDTSAPAADTPRNVTLTSDQLQHIRLYTVAQSTFHTAIEADGVVDFDNDQATSVLAPFSGSVSRLLVQPGQTVPAGDPLATVASPDYSAAVSAYAKALSTARTLRKLADMDKDLVQHNGVAQREAQQAQTDADNAEADRDAARQALVALNVAPAVIADVEQGRPPAKAEAVIRSPIAGTVVEKLITPGQLLQAGTTAAFTVANLSKVWVMAQVSASDQPSVAVGDTAEVETGAGSGRLTGVVDNISALVNPDTRTVVARVVVDNPRDALKKGMYVRTHIQSRQVSDGLLVPVSAILRDDENLPFVYAMQSDGSFAREHVTLGARVGDQYDIPQGVRAGDRIVVDGGIFVQFMQTQ